ncbi:MAG: SgcJ/EcaC family oxidoreductase [Chloroflexi bacterium]|nr:SgcJ/EcaC family oxidoreductase [Chloroflexota bacterium]
MQRPNGQQTATAQPQDIAAIKQIIATIETGFNQKDAAACVKHFTQDATVVNVLGIRVSGWSAIHEAHVQGLAGHLRDEYARYDVHDLLFLRPDVAIAQVYGWPITQAGQPIEDGQGMIAMYVMVKAHEQWWIAARQNTLLPV